MFAPITKPRRTVKPQRSGSDYSGISEQLKQQSGDSASPSQNDTAKQEAIQEGDSNTSTEENLDQYWAGHKPTEDYMGSSSDDDKVRTYMALHKHLKDTYPEQDEETAEAAEESAEGEHNSENEDQS